MLIIATQPMWPQTRHNNSFLCIVVLLLYFVTADSLFVRKEIPPKSWTLFSNLAAPRYRAVIRGGGLSVFLAASLRLNYQDMHMGNLAAAVALCSETLSIISFSGYAQLVLQVPCSPNICSSLLSPLDSEPPAADWSAASPLERTPAGTEAKGGVG